MKTILIDDEVYALRSLENICRGIFEIDVEASFSTSIKAMEYIKGHEVELVILDIEMPGMTGIEAVEMIRSQGREIGIIFVTGYEEYALKAYQLEAVAYLLKPVQEEELFRAIKRASKLKLDNKEKRVQIHTFGHFSVFIDKIPVHFSNTKAKELLALLIDQGGAVMTMEQIISVLWEDRPYDTPVKQAYRKAVMYLNQLCRQNGLSFFSSQRASCSLDTQEIDCDYLHFLEGDKSAIDKYEGEYLLDYGWAECTIPKLNRIKGTL